jgi:hypothetical protein
MWCELHQSAVFMIVVKINKKRFFKNIGRHFVVLNWIQSHTNWQIIKLEVNCQLHHLAHVMAHAHATEIMNSQLGACQHIQRKDCNLHRLCMYSSVSALALSLFINKKHIKWQNNHLQNIIDTAIYVKPYPAGSLADDKKGLFMAKWYRQFKYHVLDFTSWSRKTCTLWSHCTHFDGQIWNLANTDGRYDIGLLVLYIQTLDALKISLMLLDPLSVSRFSSQVCWCWTSKQRAVVDSNSLPQFFSIPKSAFYWFHCIFQWV